jgi:hypothetical protein
MKQNKRLSVTSNLPKQVSGVDSLHETCNQSVRDETVRLYVVYL